MKIAFPSQTDQGMDSPVFGHFGSAQYFIVVDGPDNGFETIMNADLDHEHGQCQPLAALGGKTVDAVAVGGIGGGALRKLLAANIKVYHAVEGSVSENLALIESGKLPEFDILNTCSAHVGKGGHKCIH